MTQAQRIKKAGIKEPYLHVENNFGTRYYYEPLAKKTRLGNDPKKIWKKKFFKLTIVCCITGKEIVY